MNKNKRIVSVCLLSGVMSIAAIGIVGAIGNGGSIAQGDNAPTYSLSLDKNNVPLNFESGAKVTTALGNDINLTYSGASVNANNHAGFAANGYVENDSAITDYRSVLAIFTGKFVLNYGKIASRLLSVELTSGVAWSSSEVGYNFFRLTAQEDSVLSSAAFGYNCGSYVAPSSKAPTITLTGDTSGTIREDGSFTLPSVKAATYEGLDITDKVMIKEGDTVITSSTYSGSVGTHILSYNVVDPFDNTLVATTKTVTVNIYQRILGEGGSSGISVANESTNPVVTDTDQGYGLKALFLPALSTEYYYEMTLSGATYQNGGIMAFAHYPSANINDLMATLPTEFYYNGYKFNASNYEIATSKKVTGWNDGDREWTRSDYLTNRERAISANPVDGDVKVGLARVGQSFYLFLNDKLAFFDYNKNFATSGSLPGIWSNYPGVDSTISFSGFSRLLGDSAVTKVSNIIGTTSFDYFGLYGKSISSDYADFASGGFTYKEAVSTDNCDDMNATMVTPYVHLGGTAWTLDFDVQNTLLGDSDARGSFMIDFRTLHDKKTSMLFRMNWGREKNVYETFFQDCEVGSVSDSGTNLYSEISFAGVSTERGQTLHFKIEYATTTSSAETYTYTVSNGTNSWTKVATVTYSGTNAYTFGSQKYLIFHSAKFSGIVSNFAIS